MKPSSSILCSFIILAVAPLLNQARAKTHCVFMHRSDSIYDDSPAVQYQFPKQYLRACINRSGFAVSPVNSKDRPHPQFLAWHREHCFKH